MLPPPHPLYLIGHGSMLGIYVPSTASSTLLDAEEIKIRDAVTNNRSVLLYCMGFPREFGMTKNNRVQRCYSTVLD